MECPLCKNSKSDRFEAIKINAGRVLICLRCGIIFIPINNEGFAFWEKVNSEAKE